ncbi:RNA-guided endonuclease InsQ/TnpB family protein [Vibrio agarivorans]|uniref:RNA-guided endonuclease InsQ/TnpB family protein n=1 Tax=Vibrio agarivorans TaxID=153622 RepID=UPI0022326E77|nr:transposase [Vibrio agarivorans]
MEEHTTVTTAFKTRIRVNNKQDTALLRWCSARCTAYNYALNLCLVYLDEQNRLGEKNKLLSKIPEFDKYFNANKYPLGYKRKQKGGLLIGSGGFTWIRETEVPSSACQLAIKYDLKEAWKKCFRGEAKQPHFQSRLKQKSVTLSSADMKRKMIGRDSIILPKGLGTLKLGDPIPYLDFSVGNVTFSKHSNHWYIAFTLHVPASEYYKYKTAKNKISGIDLGINVYAATSDGVHYRAPNKLSELEQRKSYLNSKIGSALHAHLMRTVASCKKCRSKVKGIHDKKHLCSDCRERYKTLTNSRKLQSLRSSVARISEKQANIRNNMGHQLTTELVKKNDTIVIENLKIKNMTASAKGTEESPGSNVKQKSGLNRALLNVAPYRVRKMLEYKTVKFGRDLVIVDPAYTSQKCRSCGYIDSKNRVGEVFICKRCGYQAHADTNAAKNIRDKYLKRNL